MHISSVIVLARTSSAPRKMPGKPSELFTWLGKSRAAGGDDAAPASLASHGQISGTGLAQAKTIASWAIALTHSGLIVPGPACRARCTHRRPPAPRRCRPCGRSAFVIWQSRHLSTYSALAHLDVRAVPCAGCPCCRPCGTSAGSTPEEKIRRVMATLAAPEPMKTISTSSIGLPTIFSALSRPASVTEAVPCWSSCHIGISAFSRRVSRMRKHLGCEMSSRLTPPKAGWSSSLRSR